MLLWIKDTNGKESASLTFAFASFAVSTLAVVAGMVETVTVGSTVIKFVTPDPTLILGYLMTMTSGYVYRRTKGDGMAHQERLAILGQKAEAIDPKE